jgi:hypothetical protein
MSISVTSKKKLDMPLCRYGAACSRKDCFYRHETKTPSRNIDQSDPNSEVCMAYLAGLCSFGDNCYNRHPSDVECESIIAKLGTKPCKYGPKCWTEGCLYNHDDPNSNGDLGADFRPTMVSAPVVVASGPVFRAEAVQEAPIISNLPSVKIPESVWRTYPDNVSVEAFNIDNAIERFAYVNSKAKPAPSIVDNEGCFVVDLHFQSTKSVMEVLGQIFPQCLRYLSADSGSRGNIWLITGSGKHVPRGSHQTRGGILYDTVLCAAIDLAAKHDWLDVSEGIVPGGGKGAIRLRHKR